MQASSLFFSLNHEESGRPDSTQGRPLESTIPMKDHTQTGHRCADGVPEFSDLRAIRFLVRIVSTDPALLPLVADDAKARHNAMLQTVMNTW